MPEHMPTAIMGFRPIQKRIMICNDHDSLYRGLNPRGASLRQGVIVATLDEDMFAIQFLDYGVKISLILGEAKIPHMDYGVIFSGHGIMIVHQNLIHFLNRREWPFTVPNDITMIVVLVC
jgi:hypothetical protein